MARFRKGPLLVRRNIDVPYDGYVPEVLLEMKYPSVKKVVYADREDASSARQGYLIQKLGKFYYLVPFVEKDTGEKLTIHTNERPFSASGSLSALEEAFNNAPGNLKTKRA